MTVLSDGEIQSHIQNGKLAIIPFDATCLNGAGYDLRLGSELIIEPANQKLTSTFERIELPADLVGTLHIRSSLARAGIIGSLALVDPGFRGQLTISLFNSGSERFSMRERDRFIQLVLHPLSMKALRPYRGKYQDSQGIVDRR
ncbi:MAG: dCTP deaminase [Candidatus Bathyarchaeia archaeon]